jgi:hypothetical protein
MRTVIARKFTVFDAMLLIAVTAVSLVLIRDYVHFLDGRRITWLLPRDWRLASMWRWATVWSGVLAPLAVSLSLAMWLLRLRKPRSKLRRLFRQPGMFATSAVVIDTSLFLVKALFSQYYLYSTSTTPVLANFLLWIMRLPWNGEVVAVAWLLLWASGSWRNEPSWIDRAGRALGVYWIASGVFFDYLFRY